MDCITLLVKPASSQCQYRCAYCFYEQTARTRAVGSHGIMQEETLAAMVEAALARAPRALSLVFQGGEPLLAGLSFYERLVSLVREKNKSGTTVQYSLQTNGKLIDDAFCRFFQKNDFLVGLSLDGPKEIHDKNRLDAAGKSTFAATMAGARLLRQHGVAHNVLAVLTDESARHAEKIYRFFRENGLDYMQFIPCIDTGEKGAPHLSAVRLGQFLCRLFDLWYADLAAGRPSYIRQFENYVNLLCGRTAEDCSMNGRCGVYFVVEADGSLYPCDFYCTDDHCLGTIWDEDPFALRPAHRAFLARSYTPAPPCTTCRYAALCRGGCYRDRVGAESLNQYCQGYYTFFEYAYERLCRVAAWVQHRG